MEGALHTAKRSTCVSWRAPLATYIKEGGGGGRPRRGAPIGGVQLGFPIPVGVPFLFQEGREGRSRRGRRKERGAPPPPKSNSDLPWGGRSHPLRPFSPFRCPNIAFQYIDLYVSTISRLLVMSAISSRTLSKLRSSNHITHNTNHHER